MAGSSRRPVRFHVTKWQLDRFAPKPYQDYDLRFTSPDFEGLIDWDAGVTVLHNRRALAPVRLCRDVRYLDDDDAFDDLYERFVATGEGWRWRDELLVVAEPGSRPDVTPLAPRKDESEASGPETSGSETASATTSATTPADVDDSVFFGTDGANGMTVDVTARAPAWLHLAFVDDGHWIATVDGEEADVVAANGPFMAVWIDTAGKHRVEFRYRPWPYRLGGIVSVTAAVLLLLSGVVVRRQTRRAARLGGSTANNES